MRWDKLLSRGCEVAGVAVMARATDIVGLVWGGISYLVEAAKWLVQQLW